MSIGSFTILSLTAAFAGAVMAARRAKALLEARFREDDRYTLRSEGDDLLLCGASPRGAARILAILAGLCLAFHARSGGAQMDVNAGAYRLRVDFSAGEWQVDNPAGGRLVGGAPLFMLDFADGTTISPKEMQVRVEPGEPPHATYAHPRAELALRVKAEPDRVVFEGEVACKEGVMTRVAIPKRFDLLAQPRTRFLWPRVLGVELNESFLASSRKLLTGYPEAFCDFCAAEVAKTPLYFYRCEPEEKPRPSQLAIQGGDPPVFWRSYTTYIRAGERWKAPAVACQVGGDLRETLLRYKKECALGKPLDQKMTPEFFDRWSKMAEARVPSPADGGLRMMRELTRPAVLYITDWMLGGFNKMFPDFLPPNAKYGGAKGFKEFAGAVHEQGHLLRPYVNFTWWSEGWEGRDGKPAVDSRPAPSLVEHGDAALAIDPKTRQTIKEDWHGCYGYTSCPGHPLVIEAARTTRDALLDDYKVDFLYQDQLGARKWILDLNPALENPADYGWAMMNIGREAAARCPIAVEYGNDRVLEFAAALNYWALPPLSPIHNTTGQARPPWEEGQGRSFPYALYLSSGDAAPQVLECLDPAWLAWSNLLGCRVSVGTLSEAIREGPDREAIAFLQQFAEALGKKTGDGARAVGDRLLDFEYLAPRVARAKFERHEVIANFSDAPWPLEGDSAVAPDGFDLRAADGFRAGRYVDPSGASVLAMLEPDATAALTLAPGGFEVRVGGRVLRADPPPVKNANTARRTGLIDFGAGLGEARLGGVTADDLATAFRALAPERIGSLDALDQALKTCRVLVNGQSQCFPVADPDDWPAAVGRLRAWLQSGGVWVELGRCPLWNIVSPDPKAGANAWQTSMIGKAGFENLYGERCWLSRRPKNPPQPKPLRVTERGRAVFSPQVIGALESQSATVTRPPADFPHAIALCENEDGPYIMVHASGYGAIARLGGDPVGAAPAALAEAVPAMFDGKLDVGGPVWTAPLCRRVEWVAPD
ncbi:MAG: hypothetical protein NTW86_13375 [Candidatus Sumerlaeota bacterium]|nr:hypothetical protein [Candidatus Sumerlaeota bacterium]